LISSVRAGSWTLPALVLRCGGANGVTATALQKCRLTAHVSIKLNRSHLITGEIALILPCLGRSEIDRQAMGEQFVTVENSMGVINPSYGVLVAVRDSGPGLDSQRAESVFDAFVTSKPGGMGLGLSICRTFLAPER